MNMEGKIKCQRQRSMKKTGKDRKKEKERVKMCNTSIFSTYVPQTYSHTARSGIILNTI